MSTTWKMPQAPPPLPSPIASRRRKKLPENSSKPFDLKPYRASGISALFHLVLFLFLALLGTGTIGSNGSGGQQNVVVTVVEASETGEGAFVENIGSTLLGTDNSSGSSQAAAGSGTGLPGSDASPVNVEALLAGIDGGGGNGGIGDVGEAAGSLGLGNGGPKLGGSASGSSGKTSVFGIEGTGRRFVYVFDRSSSMNGYTGLPMARAKSELIKSIRSLGESFEFQLIFYNEQPLAYGQLAGSMKMLQANADNKDDMERYVRKMIPDGGTEHLPALRMGLTMAPDVIFFLTDADLPGLTTREMQELTERASRTGTVIHTIQFGAGANQGLGAWIGELAKATSGSYRYIDVTTFAP